MKTLSMEKIVVVLNTSWYPYEVLYRDLEKELENDTQIEVRFPKGMYKYRMALLKKLGFTLAGEWKLEPTKEDPIWADYRGVFARA